MAHEKIVNSHGELWHPQCFVLVTYIMKKMYDRRHPRYKDDIDFFFCSYLIDARSVFDRFQMEFFMNSKATSIASMTFTFYLHLAAANAVYIFFRASSQKNS